MIKSFKIKYLYNLELGRWLNHYKMAEKANLEINDNIAVIEGNRISKQLMKLISTTEKSVGGLHFEKWLELKFENEEGKEEILYIIESRLFGFGNVLNGNNKIREALSYLTSS